MLMNLKDFSLVSPVTHVCEVLRAIEAAIPLEAIERAIATSCAQERRICLLSAHLVVSLIIAMSLWSSDSIATLTGL